MSVSVDKPDDEDDKKITEVVLPKVLEDVLALKDQRAAQFDVNVDDLMSTAGAADDDRPTIPSGVISTDYADADGDSDDEAETQLNGIGEKAGKQSKAEKNKKKKRRKKQNRKLRQQITQQSKDTPEEKEPDEKETKKVDDLEHSKTSRKDKADDEDVTVE